MITKCAGGALALLPAGANSQAAALSKSWGDILAVFDDLLGTLKANAVPKVLVQVRLGAGAYEGRRRC